MLKMVKSGTSVEKACASIKHKHKTVDKVEVKELINNLIKRWLVLAYTHVIQKSIDIKNVW